MDNSRMNIDIIQRCAFAPVETEVQAGFKNLPPRRQDAKFLSNLFSNKLTAKYVKA